MTRGSGSRVERKYTFPAAATQAVLAWLEHSCLPDPRHPHDVVSTVYYDTPALDAWREKRDGDFLKCKLRLRWYGAAQGEVTCFLEAKMREGSSGSKSRVAVTVPGSVLAARALERPEIQALPALHPEVGCSEGELAPTLLVRYDRRRFLEPRSSARVSLDTSIGCVEANQSRLAAFAPVALEVGVLEVKTPRGERPGFLGPLGELVAAGSFSKYARLLELALEPGRNGVTG